LQTIGIPAASRADEYGRLYTRELRTCLTVWGKKNFQNESSLFRVTDGSG
jgi:hypothetical protein